MAERCQAAPILDVDLGARARELLNHAVVAEERGGVQCRVAGLALRVDVGAERERGADSVCHAAFGLDLAAVQHAQTTSISLRARAHARSGHQWRLA